MQGVRIRIRSADGNGGGLGRKRHVVRFRHIALPDLGRTQDFGFQDDQGLVKPLSLIPVLDPQAFPGDKVGPDMGGEEGCKAGPLALTGMALVLLDEHTLSVSKNGNFCKAQPGQQPENNPEAKEKPGRDEFGKNLIFLLMKIFFDGLFSKNRAVCLFHMPHRCRCQSKASGSGGPDFGLTPKGYK